jgi:putative ABC transport system ATP-binding protein
MYVEVEPGQQAPTFTPFNAGSGVDNRFEYHEKSVEQAIVKCFAIPNILAGVLQPEHGRVSLLGQNWAALALGQRDAFRADHVGVIFQQFNLLPYLSVLDNVSLPCRFSKLRRERCQAAGGPEASAQTWLQRMDLPEGLWARRADTLSVGQQQRVAAARALIGQPELVLADEPTSALDAALRHDFMDVLLQAVRDAGSTLVCVSHDPQQAARFDLQWSLPELQQTGARA